MPAHLRALLVVLVLSGAMLYLSRKVACAQAIDPVDYKRRALVWLAITLAAFLTRNYWIYLLITLPMIAFVGSQERNRLSLYFFLLFVIPPFPVELPGLGLFGNFMQVDHFRWLALVLLLPAYLSLRRTPGVLPFGRTGIDKFILAYIVLWLLLQATTTTLTNVMRIGVFLFIDTFLPYYVASRALRDLPAFRDALMSLVVAIIVMAPVAMFEFARSWLLYTGLGEVLGLPYWGLGNYLERGEGVLRAAATTGHPIALGYIMSVGLGFVIFLRPSVPNRRWWFAGFLGITGGLVAAMSRGPWIGAVAMLGILLITGPHVGSKVAKAFAGALVGVPLLLTTPQGQRILDYMPFIGTVESANVEFRQRLFEVCMGVFVHFPVFGALDFMSHRDMEQMRGGDGIIDMVNTYLIMAMSTGAVGLTIFVMPFLLVCFGIARALQRMQDKSSEEHLLGRCILAVMIGIMISIATLSSILAVPIVYLSVIGVGNAYLVMLRSARVSDAQAVPPAADRAARPMRRPGGARGLGSMS